jgi:hypothetical protein
MKKYLFGIFAIVLAIGFSAFTPKKSIGKFSTTMYYQPASDFSQTAVQNKSNWSTTANSGGCGVDNKACQVVVDDAYVSGSSFISTISLVAQVGSSNSGLLDVRDGGVTIGPNITNKN